MVSNIDQLLKSLNFNKSLQFITLDLTNNKISNLDYFISLKENNGLQGLTLFLGGN